MPRYHVAVRVEDHGDVGVLKHLRDDLRVDALREQEGVAGVPEIMKANVRQACPPQELPTGAFA